MRFFIAVAAGEEKRRESADVLSADRWLSGNFMTTIFFTCATGFPQTPAGALVPGPFPASPSLLHTETFWWVSDNLCARVPSIAQSCSFGVAKHRPGNGCIH